MDYKSAKIVYMGTPQVSAQVLEGLINNGVNIVAVISQLDKPVGRNKIVTPTPVKTVANKYHIPVYQKENISKDYEFLKEINPDLILTMAFGQIVSENILSLPQYGCLNLHGSLLPKYRGAAPIQYALINGEECTGVSLMKMVKKMDAGEIYAREYFYINEDDNLASLYNKLARASVHITLTYINEYFSGKLIGEPQNELEVSFAPSLSKEEEHLDLSKSMKTILGYIKAFSPNIGAYLIYDNSKIKIFDANVYSYETSNQLGEIIKIDKESILLQCKDGVLSLKELQKEGKNKLSFKDFANGNRSLLNKILH